MLSGICSLSPLEKCNWLQISLWKDSAQNLLNHSGLGTTPYLSWALLGGWFSELLQLSCYFQQPRTGGRPNPRSARGTGTARSTWGWACCGGWAWCGSGSCPGASPARRSRCRGCPCYCWGRRSGQTRSAAKEHREQSEEESLCCHGPELNTAQHTPKHSLLTCWINYNTHFCDCQGSKFKSRAPSTLPPSTPWLWYLSPEKIHYTTVQGIWTLIQKECTKNVVKKDHIFFSITLGWWHWALACFGIHSTRIKGAITTAGRILSLMNLTFLTHFLERTNFWEYIFLATNPWIMYLVI